MAMLDYRSVTQNLKPLRFLLNDFCERPFSLSFALLNSVDLLFSMKESNWAKQHDTSPYLKSFLHMFQLDWWIKSSLNKCELHGIQSPSENGNGA